MSKLCYRVVDWDQNFENSRSRQYQKLEWVLVPNKHDGDGYTDLLDHDNGLSHYGAWVLIIQVASKCQPRGTLIRDNGQPHDARSLARITRAPKKMFQEAIERLLNIGWLEEVHVSESVDSGQGKEAEGGSPGPGSQRPDTQPTSESQSDETQASPGCQRPDSDLTASYQAPDSDLTAACQQPVSNLTPSRAYAEQNRTEGKGRESAPPTRARDGPKGENHPDLATCIDHFERQEAPPDGAYTEKEIRDAFLSLQAAADGEGRWWWGKRPVGDWRSALERRISDDREKRKSNGVPSTGSSKGPKTEGTWSLKQKIEAKQEQIDTHPANSESVYHEPECGPEKVKELKALRRELKELKTQLSG